MSCAARAENNSIFLFFDDFKVIRVYSIDVYFFNHVLLNICAIYALNSVVSFFYFPRTFGDFYQFFGNLLAISSNRDSFFLLAIYKGFVLFRTALASS